MKNVSNHIFIIFGLLAWACLYQSCVHDPILPEEVEPEPVDTMDVLIPCDPDVIYFTKDIQPILLGNCAFSGCHDATTASDDVILDTYENVINTAEVSPFNLSDSKLFEVISTNEADKVMPPTGKLDNDKINLITKWILQGAKDLTCDEECTPTDISYSDFIAVLFSTSCNGCHSATAASGGIILDSYVEVKSVVDAGRLYGAVNWNEGFSPMPQNQNQLDSCSIAKIKTWIDEGAQNN